MAGKWYFSGAGAIFPAAIIYWTGAKLAIMLIKPGYTLDQTSQYVSAITASEVSTSSTGYSRQQLHGTTPAIVPLTNPTRGYYSYPISDVSVSWTVPNGGTSFSTIGAVVYKDASVSGLGTADSTSPLLLYIDFNGTQTFVAGDTCKWVPDTRGLAWINI